MSYVCKPNFGCYSQNSQHTHAIFMGLQNLLNRFASGVGFKLLQVDGIIGAATAAAAQKVCVGITQAGVSAKLRHDAAQMTPSTNTYEELARNATAFAQFLNEAATEIGLPAVPPPPKPVTPTAPPPNTPPVIVPPFMVGTNTRRRNYLLAGAGALLAGFALVGVFYATGRRKTQEVAGGWAPDPRQPWIRDWQRIPGTKHYESSDGWRAEYSRQGFRVKMPDGRPVATGGIQDPNGQHLLP